MYGTIVSTLIAMLIAVPLSIAIALFLVELARPRVSKVVGTMIELLAAIPSIIYGMWGMFVFAPFMAKYVQPLLQGTLGFLPLFQGPPMGLGMLTAGIILAFMILPFICAITRDVFQLVPNVVKESAHGMGATTWEVTYKVTIPYGLVGIIGALFLGLGRALGETMAITFVIGNAHNISASLFAPGNSIASILANEFTEATTAMYISSLIELGLVLFVITYLVQVLAQFMLRRDVQILECGIMMKPRPSTGRRLMDKLVEPLVGDLGAPGYRRPHLDPVRGHRPGRGRPEPELLYPVAHPARHVRRRHGQRHPGDPGHDRGCHPDVGARRSSWPASTWRSSARTPGWPTRAGFPPMSSWACPPSSSGCSPIPWWSSP